MKHDAVYLRYMLECIHRIEEDTSVGYRIFMSSHTYQDAVLRNLQVLAESAQRLSEALKEQYADVEWRSIAAFRNVLVHDYLGVDLERIWVIVQQDVPTLKEAIVQILQGIEDDH